MIRRAFILFALSLCLPASASAAVTVAPPDGAPFLEKQDIPLQWEFQQANERSTFIHIFGITPTEDDVSFSGGGPLSPSQTTYTLEDAVPGKYEWWVSSSTCSGTVTPGCNQTIQSNTATFNVFDRIDSLEAGDYLIAALKKEIYGYRHIDWDWDFCDNRIDDFKFRCVYGGGIGDVSYRGYAFISFSGTDIDDNLYRYHAQGKYRKTNHYCLAVQNKPKRKCVDRKKFRF
jgi:hypothetical protein